MMKTVFKLVILGDPAVGKTSIRRQYMGRGFSVNYLPTMGADFAIYVHYDDNVRIELQIWDIAGQSSFELLTHRFISNSSAAFFVFDLTRKETFLNLPKWITKFKQSNTDNFRNLPLYLIGNKNDLEDQEVTSSQIEAFVADMEKRISPEKNAIRSFKTSAKSGENIRTIFTEIIKDLSLSKQE